MKGREEQDLKIKEYIDRFLIDKPEILKLYNSGLYNLTYATRKVYVTYVYKFLKYLESDYKIDLSNVKEYENIKLFHFNNYIERMQEYSDTYKAATVYSLKHFFGFLYYNEFINSDPTEKLKAPKDKKIHNITSLNPDEINIVKNNIIKGVGSNRQINQQKKWIKRDLSIILIGLMNGLRISEIININIDDVNFEIGKIKLIEKGNTEREIYISDGLMSVINEWVKDREEILGRGRYDVKALFISNRKERISINAARDLISKYTYNIDKHITPHKLRSTCATNVYNETGDIYLTADILGHKNIQNTRRYANVSEEKRRGISAIMENIIM